MVNRLSCVFVLLCLTITDSGALENGLARTPPMGWNSYNYFAGYWSAYSIITTADAIVSSGLKDYGYEYCVMDGNDEGKSPYFPAYPGFVQFAKPIADHLHGLGLKYGIYTNEISNAVGVARDMAAVGVDFIKIDAYNSPITEPGWTQMRDQLGSIGRPVLISIHSLPPRIPPYSVERAVANMWRTSADISYTWESVMSCIQSNALGAGVPGGWPDPDMLQVGNMLEPDPIQEMAMFSLWCVTSSPLIMGHEVRVMSPWTKFILMNSEAIAVNQDTAFSVNPSLGGAGKLLSTSGDKQIWSKGLTGGARAVVLLNLGEAPSTIEVTWSALGLPRGSAQVRDLWEHKNLGSFTDKFAATVPRRGCAFVKVVPGTTPLTEPQMTWYPRPSIWKPDTLMPLDRTGWTATSSVHLTYSPDPVSALLDGNPSTRWSTNPTMPLPSRPNWVEIDMKKRVAFNLIILDDERRGPVTTPPYEQYVHDNTYEIHVSDDGVQWRGPVAEGSWPYRRFWSRSSMISFPDQTARYLRITSKARGEKVDQLRTGFTQGYRELYVINVPGGSFARVSPKSHSPSVSARDHRLRLPGKALRTAPMTSPAYSVQGRKMEPTPVTRSVPLPLIEEMNPRSAQ